MKKILAWIIVILFFGGAVLVFIENIKNDGWFFIGSMAAVILAGALVLWAVMVIKNQR